MDLAFAAKNLDWTLEFKQGGEDGFAIARAMDRCAVDAVWDVLARSALKRKRTKQRETILQGLAYVLPLLAAATCFLSREGAMDG